jgi:hypothetical protein
LGRCGQGELHGTAILPQTSLGQSSIAPGQTDLHTGKKEKLKISNKNIKDMRERGWGTLSTGDWGKGILPGTVNKQARWAGEALAGAGARAQQTGGGKLMRVADGGKLHRRGGKTHFPHEL